MPISDEALDAMSDVEYAALMEHGTAEYARLIRTLLPLTTLADNDPENHEARMWGKGWFLKMDFNGLPWLVMVTDDRFDGTPFVEAMKKVETVSIEHRRVPRGLRIDAPTEALKPTVH
jgi:hypothetical protein